MSELKSVLLAIEHATRQRDDLLKAAARVERSLQFAQGQMAQLKGYAADTDARWISSGSKVLTGELLRHQYQFMDRLQQTIVLQTDVITGIERQMAQARAAVLQAEFRLAGLNQILKTRQASLQRTERRREQRQTDEFAALLFARNRARPMSGEKHGN